MPKLTVLKNDQPITTWLEEPSTFEIKEKT